jgi:hypothetical protein
MTIEEQIEELKKQVLELEAKCKEQEFKYPMYFRNKKNGVIVKFSNLTTGVTVADATKNYRVGYSSDNFLPHTFTDFWEQVDLIDVIPDKALVWCWDNGHLFYKELRFWDAKNKATFHRSIGNRAGSSYENYEIYIGEEPEWAIEARKIIRD